MNGNIECAFVAKVVSEKIEVRTSAAGKQWAALKAVVGQDDSAQWLKIAVFGELAQKLAPTLTKGDRIYCEGSLRLDRWKNDAGEERSGLSIAAWKCERIGVSAIGRNKPPKPRAPSSSDDGRANTATDRQMPATPDDAIPF